MYTLLGPKWSDTTITWSLVGPQAATFSRPAITSAIDTPFEQLQVTNAFSAWSSVSGLKFEQVADVSSGAVADIRIGFADFTDGGKYAGSSGQMLGTAYSSWSGIYFKPGAMVVLQDPTFWAWNTDSTGNATYKGTSVSAQQILTHEIGHALGLQHSDTPDDIMYELVSLQNRVFSADDINGIQALYGKPVNPTTPNTPPDLPGPDPVSPSTGFERPPVPLSVENAGYLALNADVRAASLNPADHYASFGWKEGRDPHAHFDTKYYLTMNKDVAASGMNPLEHYNNFGLQEGRKTADAIVSVDSKGFDAGFYLLNNADVARSGQDATQHYQNFGWKEGRDGNGYFHANDYLAANPDVKTANMDPLAHYIQFGIVEGRTGAGDFNARAYLEQNADVAASGVNPFLHYLQFGVYEGRDAHADWAL